ncbi:MAG: hypothetical protein K0U54_12705 [Bacteroidetes bacterium]|nr:hypothetical protein [Bacteroidota bacterium]
MASAVFNIYRALSRKFTNPIDKHEAKVFEDEIKEQISTVLDFLLHITTMHSLVCRKHQRYLRGPEKDIYNFLKTNALIEGPIIFKGIKFLRKISDGLSQIEKITENLENLEGISYDTSVEKLYEFLKTRQEVFWLYVDNIDDYGFDYSIRNRAFYNALVAVTMRINDHATIEKIPFRIALAIPSELFENTILWNKDKVDGRTVYLNWDKPELVKSLVNKRIAIELNIKKSNPRWDGDKYSIANEHTWNRYFKPQIKNKVFQMEELFQYILRHSLYTPRTVLDLCSSIFNAKYSHDLNEEEFLNLSDEDESELVISCVEAQSIKITQSIINNFQLIFLGFEDLVALFRGRPNVWQKPQIEGFLRENGLGLVQDAGTKKIVNNEKRLIEILFQSGFIGMGQNTHAAPQNCQQYKLSFSYVKQVGIGERWDIAAISPIFYDYVGIKREPAIGIVPHKPLTLNPVSVEKLHRYNHTSNASI